MKRASTPNFVLTLPMQCELWQRNYLDKVFRVAGNMYNNLISNRMKALRQLERSREWRFLQAAISEIYAQREQKLAGCKDKAAIIEKEYAKLLKPFFRKKNDLLSSYGFSEYEFQSLIQRWRIHYKSLVGTHVAQKLASAAWAKFQDYFYGSGKEISFCPWTRFLSIEGKTNDANILYRNGFVHFGTGIFQKKGIPVKIAKAKSSPSSAFLYEQEALSCRIKYCRIIRRWYPEGWRYFLQLVLEGEPPVKVNPKTGELLHPVKKGRVGHDIGTQTLASSGNSKVQLVELAPAVQNVQNELRRINRAMDRSRRATNPEFFNSDGTVVHKDKLPKHCLTNRGRRAWKNSNRYDELSSRRRYLLRKQAALRIQCHNEMANRLLSFGDEHYIETMNFKGLAKKAKAQKKEDLAPGERFKRRKRFGKSIANKAPAAFVNILERKVLASGGTFHRIDTWKAKASQYNHLNQRYNKKKLSQRWNQMPDGKRIQRDLYSAFLIQHTNQDLNGFIQVLCDKDYTNFVKLHDTEIARLSGATLPSSMGIR